MYICYVAHLLYYICYILTQWLFVIAVGCQSSETVRTSPPDFPYCIGYFSDLGFSRANRESSIASQHSISTGHSPPGYL